MTGAKRSLFVVLSRALVFYGIGVSLLFLLAIIWLYQLRLQEQRADAAQRINLLLQVSLENAMLKRDIPGLVDIVGRLGQQPGIEAVAIVNPDGEIRFSSRPGLVGHRIDLTRPELCPDCRWNGADAIEREVLLPKGFSADHQVLRSIKTVANRKECSQCHGDPATKPVNGLLVIDHDAQDLRRNALASAIALAGLGALVLTGLVGGIYALLRRYVLHPVADLKGATEAWAAGQFSVRVPIRGETELTDLARAFNDMAAKLQASIAQIRDRERFVEALIEALPDGVRVIDRQFRITLANKAYHRIHGLQEGAAIGTLCYRSSHGRGEPCVPTLSTCPLAGLKPGEPPVRFQAMHRTAQSGKDISVEVHAACVGQSGADAQTSLVVEVIRDLDAAVQVSHEQRLSELGQLATGIAHEIRNPLSSVAILLHEVETHSGGPDPKEVVRLITQEVGRCLSITESLLKLGSPPSAHPELIEISELVADVMQLLRYQAEEAGIELSMRLPRGLRILAADSDMRVVLINLIQNAFHAMPGGGRLELSARRTEAGKIVMRFADTGVGIPAEHLRSIFLPFWSRRADGVNGTGLGLSICRSIVDQAGGDIRVSSTPGTGTVFSVELPDADQGTEPFHAR